MVNKHRLNITISSEYGGVYHITYQTAVFDLEQENSVSKIIEWSDREIEFELSNIYASEEKTVWWKRIIGYIVSGVILSIAPTMIPLEFPQIVKEKWKVVLTHDDPALDVNVLEEVEYAVDSTGCSAELLKKDVCVDEKEFDRQYRCRKAMMKAWFLFSVSMCFILLGCGIIKTYVTTIIFSILLLIVFGTAFVISSFSLSKRKSDLLKRYKSEIDK